MNESVIIKIPTRILKEELENVNGTTFRWIEMSKLLKLDGYGCLFPSWLITTEDSLISTIEIQDEYILYGEKRETVFTVEHIEKIPGKKFKRYKYNATKFAELFQSYYQEWYKEIENCQKKYETDKIDNEKSKPSEYKSSSTVDLGHGIKKGINNITASKIIKWRHNNSIDWLALLWNLTEDFKIIKFDENWFKIDIQTSIQRENFYKKVVNCGQMQEYNFYVDIDNDLWKTHKKNAENNVEILDKIIRKANENRR